MSNDYLPAGLLHAQQITILHKLQVCKLSLCTPPFVEIATAAQASPTAQTIGSVLPGGAEAQHCGCDLLAAVLHLLSTPPWRRGVGAPWSDVAVTLVALWSRGPVVPRPKWLVLVAPIVFGRVGT